MARITLSGFITDINGSVNGWTFQNSLQGKTVRRKPVQNIFPTRRRAPVLTVPSGIFEAWGLLSDAEKIDWNDYAAANPFVDIYGNSKTLSGYQMMFSLNLRKYIMGFAPPTTAPVGVPAPDLIEDFTLVLDATTIVLTWAANFNHPDNQIWVYATLPTSQYSTNNRGKYLAITSQPTNNTTQFDITTYYNNRWDTDYATLAAQGGFLIHVKAFLVRETSGVTCIAKFATGAI